MIPSAYYFSASCPIFPIMVERKLRRMSFSLIRDVEECSSETCCAEAEANNASQVTELDRTIVEIHVDEEMNTDFVRQIKDLSKFK
jgi:hypothetical protein